MGGVLVAEICQERKFRLRSPTGSCSARAACQAVQFIWPVFAVLIGQRTVQRPASGARRLWRVVLQEVIRW